MDIALWVIGIWFAVSIVVSPIIALLGRANDPAPQQRNAAPLRAARPGISPATR